MTKTALAYRVRNFPNRARGLKAELGLVTGRIGMYGELSAVQLDHRTLVDLLLQYRRMDTLRGYIRWLRRGDAEGSYRLTLYKGRAPVDLRSHRDLIQLCRADPLFAPALIDLGVLSRRVVTTAGVNFLVDAFQNIVEIELMNFHASGTGAVAEAVGDTALGAEVETRETGTQSEPAANQYRTLATHTYAATFAITEHGIFSASTAGTLWDRSVFAAINVVASDAIEFTYTLTVNSGG